MRPMSQSACARSACHGQSRRAGVRRGRLATTDRRPKHTRDHGRAHQVLRAVDEVLDPKEGACQHLVGLGPAQQPVQVAINDPLAERSPTVGCSARAMVAIGDGCWMIRPPVSSGTRGCRRMGVIRMERWTARCARSGPRWCTSRTLLTSRRRRDTRPWASGCERQRRSSARRAARASTLPCSSRRHSNTSAFSRRCS